VVHDTEHHAETPTNFVEDDQTRGHGFTHHALDDRQFAWPTPGHVKTKIWNPVHLTCGKGTHHPHHLCFKQVGTGHLAIPSVWGREGVGGPGPCHRHGGVENGQVERRAGGWVGRFVLHQFTRVNQNQRTAV